jgi:hypothetical protein
MSCNYYYFTKFCLYSRILWFVQQALNRALKKDQDLKNAGASAKAIRQAKPGCGNEAEHESRLSINTRGNEE